MRLETSSRPLGTGPSAILLSDKRIIFEHGAYLVIQIAPILGGFSAFCLISFPLCPRLILCAIPASRKRQVVLMKPVVASVEYGSRVLPRLPGRG